MLKIYKSTFRTLKGVHRNVTVTSSLSTLMSKGFLNVTKGSLEPNTYVHPSTLSQYIPFYQSIKDGDKKESFSPSQCVF